MAGQAFSGIAAAQQARYRSQVAQQNKELARESAIDEISRGTEQQRELGREIAQTVGAQNARIAANNLDPNFGSASMVVEDTENVGREDQKALAENINRRVRGFQIDAWNYESEKRAAKAEARNTKISTAINVTATALGGATQYSKYRAGRNG